MRRFVWGLIVVVTCAGAVAFGWRLQSGYDAAIPDPGTVMADSIWIRNCEEEGRMHFPDGFGGHREPFAEIDRLTVRVESLMAASTTTLTISDSTAPVLTSATGVETLEPWGVSDTTWFAEHDGNRDIVLLVDGARMINTGDPGPLYLDATLHGRLYWVKGEWVFKGIRDSTSIRVR